MSNFHINLSDKSQKVWGFCSYSNEKEGEYDIIFYYGRIGIPMQKLTKANKSFSSSYDCHVYLQKKIKEKLHKDYINIETNIEYFGLVDQYNEKEISRDVFLAKTKKLLPSTLIKYDTKTIENEL